MNNTDNSKTKLLKATIIFLLIFEIITLLFNGSSFWVFRKYIVGMGLYDIPIEEFELRTKIHMLLRYGRGLLIVITAILIFQWFKKTAKNSLVLTLFIIWFIIAFYNFFHPLVIGVFDLNSDGIFGMMKQLSFIEICVSITGVLFAVATYKAISSEKAII